MKIKNFLFSIVESKNKTLLAFCFCFVLATAVFSIVVISRDFLFYFYLFIFVLLFFAVIFFEKKIVRLFLLAGVFFTLGICRLLFNMPVIDSNFISFYNDQEQIVTGVISDEPNKKVGWREYKLSASWLEDKNGIKRKVSGKVLFRAPSYPEFFYGDKLQFKCALKTPKNMDNFNYQKFLALKKIYSVCYPGEIKVVGKNQGNKTMSKILSFKRQINNLTQRLWNEPQSTLAGGILYGERSGFDNELKDNFSRAGITHIVAVSGYNITIIVWILMSVLIWAGFYRRQAFWICLVLIFLFVIFTGASASAARAGLMGSLVLLAQQLGRKSDVFRLLVYAATLLALVNPLILVWDVGFQLSFLATVGLIYLTPLLEEKIKQFSPSLIPPLGTLSVPLAGQAPFLKKLWGIKKYPIFLVKEFLLPTLAAMIFIFPLVSYSFGYFSLLSILANVLILWLIPLLMFFSFVSIVLATIFYPLGQVLAWITNIGLSYVIMIGEKFGGLSWASLNFNMPLVVCLGIYVGLFWIIIRRKEANKF